MTKELYRYKSEADTETAILYLIHGFADYCGRYDHFKEYLNNEEISFYGHDQEGHGKTITGVRAYVRDFDIFVNDTIAELEEIKKSKSDTSIFLFGHSMGGLVTLRIALKRPDLLAGIILSAPLIKLSESVSPFMRKLAWGMSAVLPRFYTPWNSIDRDKLTPNLTYRERDMNDPLIWHAGCRAGMAVEMFKACEDTQQKLKELKVKTLILHAVQDEVCDIAGSKELAELLPDIVELQELDLKYHSLLHLSDEETKKNMALVVGFIHKNRK